MQLDQEYTFSQGLVRYGTLGAGPPVVLVHGTPWSSYVWHHLAPVLARTHQVFFYDLIGYGRSQKHKDQQVSLAVQGELLCELLDHWDISNPTVIVHDIGGATALRAHLIFGRDFEKLMLINVVAMAPWGSPFFAHVREHESVFSDVPAYIHKAIVEAYISGAASGPLDPRDFQALVSPWLDDAGQRAFYRQIAQATQRHTDDVEPDYANIRCPVRILWGEDDDWIPLETGRRLHAAIPHSDFFPIAHAGHLGPLEKPEVVEKQVLDFLS